MVLKIEEKQRNPISKLKGNAENRCTPGAPQDLDGLLHLEQKNNLQEIKTMQEHS